MKDNHEIQKRNANGEEGHRGVLVFSLRQHKDMQLIARRL